MCASGAITVSNVLSWVRKGPSVRSAPASNWSARWKLSPRAVLPGHPAPSIAIPSSPTRALCWEIFPPYPVIRPRTWAARPGDLGVPSWLDSSIRVIDVFSGAGVHHKWGVEKVSRRAKRPPWLKPESFYTYAALKGRPSTVLLQTFASFPRLGGDEMRFTE
jgi:hypothetical protein